MPAPVIQRPGCRQPISTVQIVTVHYTLTLDQILKTIIFLNSKEIIRLYRDKICKQLVHYSYNKQQATRVVQLYHAGLDKDNKKKLYAKFKEPSLKICIMVSLDVLPYSVDILDINCSV